MFFDAMGIKYEYEPEGYDLGELGWYLPDFWLPEHRWHVEVKGKNVSGLDKARYFDNFPPEYSMGVLIVSDLSEIEEPIFGSSWRDWITDCDYTSLIHMMQRYDCYLNQSDWGINRINKAVLKARQARFEHGG